MSQVPNSRPAFSGDVVLQGLRWALHLSVAVLLVICTVRATGDLGADRWVLTIALAVIFASVYGLGVWMLPRASRIWLGLLTLLWCVLLIMHPDFSWLAFPLFFLHMHLLTPLYAVMSVAGLTTAVVAAQWWSTGVTMPSLLGPVFGAVAAVVMALAYQSLHAENRIQQQALEQLRQARAALAQSQREAGALAERERMAREIHDTLAQGFSSVVLLARAAESSLRRKDTETAISQLGVVERTAAENLDQARRLVRGQHDGDQSQQPLAESLNRACQNVEAQAAAQGRPLRCRLVINGETRSIPAELSVALLRAAQASLSNVSSHANASSAVVTLTYLESQVLLDVVDDGEGFSPEQVSTARADGSGFGLDSVRRRMEDFGGEFRVESAPGSGTAVAVRLPLERGQDGGSV